MTPRLLHKICARPVVLSGIPGACALNVLVVTVVSKQASLKAIASDVETALLLAFCLIPATLLGAYLGMFICGPFIRLLCRRINGAPFKAGDQVMILSGPLKGGRATVEEISFGQGGQEVVWLDLGPERMKDYSRIFEEYSLLKISNGETDRAAP